MQQLTNITNSPKQQFTIQLENGDIFELFLHYNARMEAWFFSFNYNDIAINDLKVCLHPNILRNYRRIIPFGIAFIADNLVEPFQVESFTSNACSLYILNEEEVNTIEEYFFSYYAEKHNFIKSYTPDGAFAALADLKNYIRINNISVTQNDYAFIISDGKYSRYSYIDGEWVRS